MRRLFTISFVLLFALTAMAEDITKEQALDIAAKFLSAKSNVVGATRMSPNSNKVMDGGRELSVAKASTGYYAINRGSGSGYVIVAANDRLGAEVLGYADNGSVDTLNMPDNLRWWLSTYDAQAAYAAKHGTTAVTRATSSSSSRAEIEPLLTCNWNQDSPYNQMCPTYNGKTCAVGCVATAMAQVMYYHKWPKQGTDSISYEWKQGNQTLSKDFSKSTYDWEHMTDTYSSSSTDTEKNAVAQLMVDAGYAARMQYGESSSSNGLKAAQGLVNYFGYDKCAHFMPRNAYSSEEWQDSLYGELKAKRPVLYYGSDRDVEGGHAFVMDGYKDGYYHVNWGWSGISDGYFVLTDLTPAAQGTGGSAYGYSYEMFMIVGVKPASEGSSSLDPLALYNYGDFKISGNAIATRTARKTFSCIIYQYSTFEHSLNFGLKVVDSKGKATYLEGESGIIKPDHWVRAYDVSMNDFPTANGTYDVYPACYEMERGEWVDVRSAVTEKGFCQSHVVATVSGNTIKFSDPSAPVLSVEATDVTITTGKIYAGKMMKGTATITAIDDYYGEIYVGFLNDSTGHYDLDEDNAVLVDLKAGESQSILFRTTAPTTVGKKCMCLFASKTDSHSISPDDTIYVNAVPTDSLSLIPVSISMLNENNVDPMDINITFKVRCASGFFDGIFYAVFFGEGAQSSSDYLVSDDFLLGADTTATVTFSGAYPSLAYNTRYFVVIYYRNADDGSIKRFTQSDTNSYMLYFTTAASSGIESVESQDGQQQTFNIYSINGTLVAKQRGTKPDLSALPKGVYIVNGKKMFK